MKIIVVCVLLGTIVFLKLTDKYQSDKKYDNNIKYRKDHKSMMDNFTNQKNNNHSTPPPLPQKPSLFTPHSLFVWGLLIILVLGLAFSLRAAMSAAGASSDTVASVEPEGDKINYSAGIYLIGRTAVGLKLIQKYNPTYADPQIYENSVTAIRQFAGNYSDQVIISPVIGELTGYEDAIMHIEKVLGDPGLPDSLRMDLEIYRDIYLNGPDVISGNDREIFISRQGWFGKLALLHNDKSSDAFKTEIEDPAIRTAFMVSGFTTLFFGASVAGLVLFIIGIIWLKKGRIRPAYPEYSPAPTGNEVFYLEAMVLFIGITFFIFLAGHFLPRYIYYLIYGLSPLSIVWVNYRGKGWNRIFRNLGLYSGKGVLKEIGCGIIGYFAGLPIVLFGMYITITLTQLTGEQPVHPIINEFQGADYTKLASLFFLACIVAPIIEETIFRGLFYHYLRRHFNILISALITGLIFALIHPQGFTAVPAIAAIGINLCLIREWRGSLVASMVAHGTNNFVITSIAVFLLN